MKATVNFEFGSEEIEGFVKRALTDGILDALGQMEPQHMQMMLSGIQTGIGMVLGQVNEIRIRRGGQARPPGPYAGPHGPPPPQGYGTPGPYAPPPSVPYPTSPGYGATGPSNVRSIRDPAEVAECFLIEATRAYEEGWGCCRCATYNSATRPVCRNCSHARCGAMVTPAPAQQPPPQVSPVGQPTEEPPSS